MSKNLSQIITEIFAKPMESKELSLQIQHLGDEIRKVMHSEDTVFGKFRGLLESFRTVIPDEKQRHQAALQALSTTSKLSRQEIIKAINGQLEELKIVETGLMSPQSGWRDGLKSMGSRSQQLKGEIAQLRERLTQLESEEKAVQAHMSAREKDLDLAEKTVKELFANIVAEISALNKKVEEWTADAPVAQPSPPAPTPPAVQPTPPAAQPGPKKEPEKGDVPGKRKDSEQKAEIKTSPPQQDTRFQRKCPMCGGPYHLLELEKIWQCFTCAYEEPATDAVQGTSEEKSEPIDAPAETPGPTDEAATFDVEPLASMVNEPAGLKKGPSQSGSQTGANKKSCPVCYKKMIWYPGEKVWRCPSGHHERRGGPGSGSRW
jgi:ribosomal protein L37AE/L43A/predicted  nucleic acid-binding Zn-ribbon protein